MKSVIITGTSKGIGLQTALAFARAGYKVFATMRNPVNAVDFRQKIQDEGLAITISAMDVDDDESVKSCIGAILLQNGPIDVLVNNAGIEYHGSIEEVPLADFKAVMETNYFGAVRCIKAVLPQMREGRSGCIINVSSISGRVANTPMGPYAASKFALEAISEALAQEIKPFNVRIAMVEPGIIDTKMARDIATSGKSIYPQVNRFGGIFEAMLKNPTPAKLVANKILEIAGSGTWQLRHPVGPDALPTLGWRARMNDEEWVSWHAASNKEWYKAVRLPYKPDPTQGE